MSERKAILKAICCNTSLVVLKQTTVRDMNQVQWRTGQVWEAQAGRVLVWDDRGHSYPSNKERNP